MHDYVYAFTPRRADGPRFVAEADEPLDERVGEYIGAEQCDGCGNWVYQVVKDGNRFYAVCALDPSDDEHHPDPCGARYAIHLYPAEETVF